MLLNQGLDLNRFSTSRGSIKKSSVGVDFPIQRLSLGDFASDRAGESGRVAGNDLRRGAGLNTQLFIVETDLLYPTGSPVYQLYALCNCLGGVHYGHYTALCQDMLACLQCLWCLPRQ